MSSRFAFVVALVVAGCAVEHGNPPPGQQAASPGVSPHEAPGEGAPAPGIMHQVFARSREVVAPGVVRLTVRVVVRMEGGREAARATMEAVAADARQRDSTVAAVRVLGYLPPSRGHGEEGGPGFVPLAYLEWVPAGGWDAVTAGNAKSPHHTDVMFVQDIASHPRSPGGGGR